MILTEWLLWWVWEKGEIIEGYDPNRLRKDACGAWMLRSAYGDRLSLYGWEIDTVVPREEGGTDSLENLRPLQWQNTEFKIGRVLVCAVVSELFEKKENPQRAANGIIPPKGEM